MTREEAMLLKPFQIVKYNVKSDDLDEEDKWLLPVCGKLAVVTQRIVWDDYGEEIHLIFPLKSGNSQEFYSSLDELVADWNAGHDIRLGHGFDTGCDYIDLV